jgi:proline dehydrogenase
MTSPGIEAKLLPHNFEDTSIAFASKSDAQLRKMYLIFAILNNNRLMNLGKSSLQLAFRLKLPVKWLVKKTVFEHFCGGENIEECAKTIQKLAEYNIGTILDYSVEGEKNEAAFEATAQEVIRTIEKAAQATHIPFSVFKLTGIAPFELLQKVQEKAPLSAEEEKQWQKVRTRLLNICQKASDLQVKLLIDGEESWIQDTIDTLCYEMMARFNRDKAIIYNTYQMYRADMLGNLQSAFAEARQAGYFLGAKLVRGAYMEKERARAAALQYPDPIQPDKAACDRDFDAAVRFCMDNIMYMGLCAGTHNEQSNLLLARLIDAAGLPHNDARIYFAQLYGMSDQISYTLAQAGYNIAKYVPYGPVASVMPYLFRRAEENTSVAGQSSREFMLIKKERIRRKSLRQ